MASLAPLPSSVAARPCSGTSSRSPSVAFPVRRVPAPAKTNKRASGVVVSAVGDVSADSTVYLVAGAAAIALIGTAFPILFSRKDLCPECDGAGFVRAPRSTLRANAARKDQAQIVCPVCNGLGKLGQIDK